MNNLIPKPTSLSTSNGSFKITSETRIITSENTEISQIGKMLAEDFHKFAGLELETQVGNIDPKNKTIEFSSCRSVNQVLNLIK